MRSDKAFTLIEALAAVVLIAGGITATVQCLGGMARARARAFETEDMARLAYRKYDELLATGELKSGRTQGDFPDEKRFVWRAERTAIGKGNLDAVRVEVRLRGDENGRKGEAQGLVCRPKEGTGG